MVTRSLEAETTSLEAGKYLTAVKGVKPDGYDLIFSLFLDKEAVDGLDDTELGILALALTSGPEAMKALGSQVNNPDLVKYKVYSSLKTESEFHPQVHRDHISKFTGQPEIKVELKAYRQETMTDYNRPLIDTSWKGDDED